MDILHKAMGLKWPEDASFHLFMAKDPELWRSQNCLLHHGNMPSSKSDVLRHWKRLKPNLSWCLVLHGVFSSLMDLLGVRCSKPKCNYWIIKIYCVIINKTGTVIIIYIEFIKINGLVMLFKFLRHKMHNKYSLYTTQEINVRKTFVL